MSLLPSLALHHCAVRTPCSLSRRQLDARVRGFSVADDMKNVLKREFSVENIGLTFSSPQVFYLPQWRWPKILYVLYRVALAIFTASCLLNYVIVTSNNPEVDHHVLVYLTTWSYIVLTLHFNVAAAVSLFCICRTNETDDGSAPDEVPNNIKKSAPTSSGGTTAEKPVNNVAPSTRAGVDVEAGAKLLGSLKKTEWYMKLSWLLNSISFVSALVVTTVYFGGVFPYLEAADRQDTALGISFADLSVHGINAVLVLLDAAFSAYPVRLYHALYPMLYGLMYMVFNISYWYSDKNKNVIYDGMLDWNHPMKSIILVLILAFVATPLLQLLHFALYNFRCCIHRRLSSATES